MTVLYSWHYFCTLQTCQTGRRPTERDLEDLNSKGEAIKRASSHVLKRTFNRKEREKRTPGEAVEAEREDFSSVLLPPFKCTISADHIY